MKRKIWINHLIGAAFAFVLSVTAVGNLVTGYDLEVKSIALLFLWCAFCSLISALLFGFKYGGAVLLCLTVLAAPKIWKDGALWEQLQSISYIISSHFHEIYNWPILGKPITDEVSLPFIVLSAWAAISVSWSFCRRKHLIIAMPSVILPLVICLITTDRVPDTIYLYLLMLGVALLLVTDWTRRNHPGQGIKLTFRLAIPIAAAFALLFVTNPREAYVNNVGIYQKEVISWLQKLQNTTDSTSGGVSPESTASQKLNLRYVGPKSRNTLSVMQVKSPIDGTIYLRGRDYDVYSGTGWEASLDRTESFTTGSVSSGDLIIVTYGVQDVLYVPYYSTEEIHLTDGALKNDNNLQRYSFYLSRSASGGTDTPDSSYTELPSDTHKWATQLVNDITAGLENESEKILRIQNFVLNSATYDLSTSRMRSQYDDFAQWFLEESETGYCVHFATAATVLLRAAGIPARYVEGYMVSCNAGKNVVVSNQEAHAWAEYYDVSSDAWCVLEATPADLQAENETATSISAPLEESEPDVSETEFNDLEDVTTIPHASQEVQPSVPDAVPDITTGQEISKDSFRLPDWMETFFWIMLAMASIPAQSNVRIDWKRKQWSRGKANNKTLVRWRQTQKLAKLVDIPFPEELESLAHKANYSQHRIQPDELQQFEDYREILLEAVRSKPWYQRILLRWIFAIDS